MHLWGIVVAVGTAVTLFPTDSWAQDLAAPNSLTPYDGGARQGGLAEITQPGFGFFVQGGTIEGMNGVYTIVYDKGTLPRGLTDRHQFHLVYQNRVSDWTLGLVAAPDRSKPYRSVGGLRSEWLFVDEQHKDRFGHVSCCYCRNRRRRRCRNRRRCCCCSCCCSCCCCCCCRCCCGC